MENQKIKDGTPVFAVRMDESGNWFLDDAWRASTRPAELLWRYNASSRKIEYCWLKGKDGERSFSDAGEASDYLSSQRNFKK